MEVCRKCALSKDIGLEKLIFSSNTMYRYTCANWIVALLRDLDRRLKIAMWNNNQEEYSSPFDNTGNEYIGNVFEVHAYSWDDDVKYNFNFKCGNIEISWYKYLGRDTIINGIYSSNEIIKMYELCLEEINKLDNKFLGSY